MSESGKNGLARAREIYQDRARRAKELRAQGRKVIGYLCLYPPVEMLTAFGLVPYRLFGDMNEPITKADTYLPTVVCPFLRSLLDLGLKGKYDFLDGVVMAHTCDVGGQIPGLWNNFVKMPYSYFIDTPHTLHAEAREEEKAELSDFQKSLETLSGKKLTSADLKKAIEAHNRQRALVRELYDLRKPSPPLITGAEILQTLVAVMSLPVEEGSELLAGVMREVKARQPVPARKSTRLLVWGPVIHETPLIDMIESLDAYVVMDDTCVGSRAYFTDIKITPDPLDGLADYYLAGIKCPRTFVEKVSGQTGKDHASDLETRFSYLGELSRDWKVDGVILQSVRYCDSHGYEVPAVKEYLSSQGLPGIYLEHDNSRGALAPLKTRVQGFLEIIGK
jgi:benzoyl-CoA reductase subunit C